MNTPPHHALAIEGSRKTFFTGIFVAAAFFTFAACASSQSSAPNHARVDLIADQGAITPDRPSWVGLLFHLDKGWHVYWRNPGDSGEPPRVEWKLPAGLRAGAIEWPRPIRLGAGTVIDYGYENRVLLMSPIHVMQGTSPLSTLSLSADVRYIVCREICVPGRASLSLAVPLTAEQSVHLTEWRGIFQETRTQLPKPAPATWKISALSQKAEIIVSVKGLRESHVLFFPLEPSVIDNSASQKVVQTVDGFQITLQTSDQLLKPVPVLKGLLAFDDGGTFQIAPPVVSGPR